MPLTDEQFREVARSIAGAALDVRLVFNLESSEMADLAGAALVEALGQCLGSVGATVDRLRDIADRLEDQGIAALRASGED